MSVAADLLRRVEALGARVKVDEDGEHLRVAPATVLPPELLDELREHKRELLALLVSRPTWPGSWHGWSAAFRHELARLMAEGLDLEAAERQALGNLPEAPTLGGVA